MTRKPKYQHSKIVKGFTCQTETVNTKEKEKQANKGVQKKGKAKRSLKKGKKKVAVAGLRLLSISLCQYGITAEPLFKSSLSS